MNRIDTAFKTAAEQKRAAFVAYVCAGDPDPETSFLVCKTLIDEGTDILELGVPFSDPLADGLTNQLAAERALSAGMDQEKVFQLVRRIREISQIPIVFYTYYNLVHSQGLESYACRAVEAGVDGLLILDLPPEEAGEMENYCEKHGLKTVYIVAPTSPIERIQKICARATGFIYYVSQEGVTGERDKMAADLVDKVNLIKEYAELPVVVGFGISKPEHVRQVASIADGAVVGSALVNCIAHNIGEKEAILAELRNKLQALCPALGKE